MPKDTKEEYVKEKLELLDKELDVWVDSWELHSHRCASHNEGLYCCLDKESSALGGKIGRDWVKSFLTVALSEAWDRGYMKGMETETTY